MRDITELMKWEYIRQGNVKIAYIFMDVFNKAKEVSKM